MRVAVVADVVDRTDVGVAEDRRRPGLAKESGKDRGLNKLPIFLSWDRARYVVPERQDAVKSYAERFANEVRKFDARLIDAIEDIDEHAESSACRCLEHQRLDHCHAFEQDPLADPCEVRKQTMFDGIVLRAMRWIVRDADGQTREIGELLQSILEANAPTATRSTAVEQRQKSFRATILMNPVLTPPIQHRIDHKVTGIVAGVQMHVSFVPSHVVKAVRNDNARSMPREIMIPTAQRGRREHPPGRT